MVDRDSHRAMPMREMALMIIEEEHALRLRKAMNLHSVKLPADPSIVTRAPDIGVRRAAQPRTLAILGKRRRSEVAQVLVALHRKAETGAAQQQQQDYLEQTISATTPAPERRQYVDEHQRCCDCVGNAATAELAQEVKRNEESKCEKDDEEQICTTPTHSSRQKEGFLCPPPPSKPASKPREPIPSHKKFFVPTNLANLPHCFKSLFTSHTV